MTTASQFVQKISFRLPAMIVGAAFLACLAVGIGSYFDGRSGVIRATDRELTALLESRKTMLERYLRSIEQDLATQSNNPLTFAALDAFTAAWRELPGNPTESLQKLYIADNPNPTGQKEKLDAATDGSAYSQAHAAYHPYFRKFLQERGYYDIFLFDTEGNLVYTVFKEPDYATNLNSGKWKDSDLGNVFRAALATPEPGKIAFFDFRPYAPSKDAPASFIGTPLIDAAGAVKGVLVFQMPVDEMNGLMQEKAGLGETGQTYIVGRDLLMRSQDRFTKDQTILARKIETDPVKNALEGKSGVTDVAVRDGQPKRAAFASTDFHGTRWAFIAERTLDEISIPVVQLRNDVIMISAAIFVVVAVIGFFFARRLVRPMNLLSVAMRQLADGDKTTEIAGENRADEIGEMASAVGVFKENMIENERLQAEQREAETRAREEEARRAEEKRAADARAEEEKRAADARAEADRKQAMLGMAETFEKSVMGIVDSLSSAATEMQSSAESMSATAEQTSRQATAVAAASEEASTNVQTVASSAEELSSSIEEISRQVSQSNQIAQNAVTEVNQTNERVEGLADAAQKIGDVVNLINDIASQTNLLALNATIEAARAGDAGKGFAVVASEVKSLATQTAKATEEIGAQIAAIQAATGDAVQAIKGIGTTVGQMGEIATSVASAVEEQGAATREIAGSVQQAASGTQEVSSNIDQVTQAASESQAASGQMLDAAKELAQQGDVLRKEVDRFLESVRAA